MAERQKPIHAGHRGRLREEFRESGARGWSDHKLLELILCYAVPRGDVNPTAHALIDRFGALDRVLDALPGELEQIPGVGENTVTLLKLFPVVMSRYLDGRSGPGQMVHTAAEAQKFLAPFFCGARNEMTYILCLDSKEKVLGARKISEGNIRNSDVNIRRVAEECMALRASFCYLAHNHVSNIALPSPEDWNTTAVIRAALAPLGVRVLDHLIFVDGDMVSLEETAATRGATAFRLATPEERSEKYMGND